MGQHKQKANFFKRYLLRLFFGVVLFWSGVLYGAVAGEATTSATDSDFIDIFFNAKTEYDTSYIKSVRLYYRVNRTEIEKDYMDNAHSLSIIDQMFIHDKLEEEDFVVITGRASPEGNFNNNQRLAKERALSLKNYIKQKYPEINDGQIIALSDGEDWDGLVEMVEKDANIPGRNQLLQILNSDLSREVQKSEIKKVAGGEAYSYLLIHILPYLRGSATGSIYFKKREAPEAAVVETIRVDTVFIEKEIVRIDTVYIKKTPQKQKKAFVIAVKNNLLYDAILLPNLTVELPFGRNYNWSAGIEGNWAWWNTGADSYYYYRIQTVGIELRRWFGNRLERPLKGWHIGLYGYLGTYDIRLFTNENSDEGQLSNRSYSGGLTFGYAMPIAKSLNLEFSIGAGYLGGDYHTYTVGACEECVFPWKSSHQRNYFGPTKLGVSLVWLIGNGFNKKEEEEGER